MGLNHSLRTLYTDSSGNAPEIPPWLVQSMEKLARIQRKLARMERGSQNYEKQLQKLRLQYERIANQRKDFIHKESRRIANAWDAVCMRDLDLVEFSQKVRGVNVMSSGFGMFRECLKYKLERQGKAFISVDRYAPIAKTCHACGHIHETLPARDKVWSCPRCGASLSREANAARNLRDLGLARYCQENRGSGAA